MIRIGKLEKPCRCWSKTIREINAERSGITESGCSAPDPANRFWRPKIKQHCWRNPIVLSDAQQAGGQLLALTPCGAYTNVHVRLNRSELLMWRRRRFEAERDIRVLENIRTELLLEESNLLSSEDLDNRLQALDSFLLETRERFSL